MFIKKQPEVLSLALTVLIWAGSFMFPVLAQAQSAAGIKGIIVKSQSVDRLAQVRVTNLKSHETKLSDDHGLFNIAASVGDSLEFEKTGYASQKQAVTSMNDLVIYMLPELTLNTVVINGTSVKQDQQDVKDAYKSKGVYYNGKPSVLSYVASPINGLYEAFSKDAKRARRFNEFVKADNESIQVDKKFSKSLVKQITGLTDGDELMSFMETYRPKYEEIVKWSDYDVIIYIKKSFASYTNLKNAATDKPVS